MTRFAVIAFIVSAVTVQTLAQSAPSFQVASIRPSTPGTPASQKVTPGRLDFVSTSLGNVVLAAFRIDSYRLSAPAWLYQVRFDIHATFPEEARARVPEMLQRLLVERFGLVSHTEPRPMNAYELLVGKDGLKMAEAEPANDLARDFSKEAAASSNDRVVETFDGPIRTMIIPSLIGGRTVTARSLYVFRTTPRQTTEIDATRITMPEFAGLLYVNLSRPVIDRTGLPGVYRFKVELDRIATAARVASALPADRQSAFTEPTGVSTFKAVESLGLRLEERRAPIDVLVIDKIAQTPTDN